MPGLRKTFPGPYFQRTLTKNKYNFQVDYMLRRSLHPFPDTRKADFNFYATYNRSASCSFYPLKIQGFLGREGLSHESHVSFLRGARLN